MGNEITALQSALHSLSIVARSLPHDFKDDAMALKEPICWGWHTIGLLAYLRLRPARHTFDAWIHDYLHEGSPELEIERDAYWEERERLSFLELLDLLSEEELPSLKPEFYQGWQDRTTRCRWLRKQVNKVIGKSIDQKQRDQLLLLLAVYHRLTRLPAGVILDTGKIIEAIPSMLDLAEMLIDRDSPSGLELLKAVETCRDAVRKIT